MLIHVSQQNLCWDIFYMKIRFEMAIGFIVVFTSNGYACTSSKPNFCLKFIIFSVYGIEIRASFWWDTGQQCPREVPTIQWNEIPKENFFPIHSAYYVKIHRGYVQDSHKFTARRDSAKPTGRIWHHYINCIMNSIHFFFLVLDCTQISANTYT